MTGGRPRGAAFPLAVPSLVLFALLSLLSLVTPPALLAGGVLDTPARVEPSSPIPGHYLAESVSTSHDPRCVPVPFVLDTSLDPLPNPYGPPAVTLDEAAAVLDAVAAQWTDVATSYAELSIERRVGAGSYFQTFDTINEIHFRAPSYVRGALAVAPSITLIEETDLVAGTDIDGDGDGDVAAGIATCTDVDGDGDRELPEGVYAAGTPLDSDVWFNTGAIRFTVDPSMLDDSTVSVDLAGIALHELGHSLGLAHSLVNQISATDGTGATMYPFADPGDPDSELALGTLSDDDRAAISLLYPEGTAPSGPAALQAGDVAFDAVYGRITGSVQHGVLDQPVVGASISAVDRQTGAVVASTVSGSTARYYFDPTTYNVVPLPGFDSLVDGAFELAVPAGSYDLRMEPMDDFPVPGYRVSYVATVGYLLGIYGFPEYLSFPEESWHRGREGALEPGPSQGTPVHVSAGSETAGIDFVTDRSIPIENFGSWDWVLYETAPAGLWYAVRIPGDQVLDAAGGERFSVRSIEFDTYVLDNSVPAIFAEAQLTTGRVLADGTIQVDLDTPLVRQAPFVAQEFDFAPLYPEDPVALGDRLDQDLRSGAVEDLFLVLRVPTESPFSGFHGFAPVIGIDGPYFGFNDGPIYGQSYLSFDGETFLPDSWNYRFRLVLSALR